MSCEHQHSVGSFVYCLHLNSLETDFQIENCMEKVYWGVFSRFTYKEDRRLGSCREKLTHNRKQLRLKLVIWEAWELKYLHSYPILRQRAGFWMST